MTDAWLKTATVVTAAVMAGEAIGLFLAEYLWSPKPNPWISPRNTLWLVSDLVCGVGLAYLALGRAGPSREAYTLALVLPALVSHLYREWEYLSHTTAGPYLENETSWMVNTLKLAGLGIVGVMLVT